MKYTLLQMTQEILSSMDSDEVNSLTETTEATQVARCIRQAYFDMVGDFSPPEQYELFKLDETGLPSPVIMVTPETVNKIIWIKYDKILSGETDPRYETLEFMPMDQFLDRMYLLNADESNVDSFNWTVSGESFLIKCTNDRAPTYYTVLGDDYTILFDSYDSDVDTYLQKIKTECWGQRTADFPIADFYTPDLDEDSFTRLLNEAKVLAFAELKSVDHAIANRNARRSRTRSQTNKYRVKRESDFDRLPNFARMT